MPDRLLKDWIQGYIEYTSFQESPELFHKWNAISIIAAAMERHCWIDYGYFKLYPNQYIILIGASAEVRKSSAIVIMEKLYKTSLPQGWCYAQKITAQAFISFMKKSFAERKVSGGYIIADELSVFLGDAIKDTTLIQLLTKIYTCPDTLDYQTQARGLEQAHNSFCNLLGGTTPEWIRDSFPGHAIEGGFSGRILFVYAEKTDEGRRFPPIAFNPRRQEIESKIRDLQIKLSLDLQLINKLEGEFYLNDAAKEHFNHWYIETYNPNGKNVDLKGYFGRKHDMLLKLTMALSASERQDKVITPEHILKALRLLGEIEVNLPNVMNLIQASPEGHQQHKIVAIIGATIPDDKGFRKMLREDLMRRFSYKINARQLDEMVTTLLQSQQLETFLDAKTNKIWYRIPLEDKKGFIKPI